MKSKVPQVLDKKRCIRHGLPCYYLPRPAKEKIQPKKMGPFLQTALLNFYFLFHFLSEDINFTLRFIVSKRQRLFIKLQRLLEGFFLLARSKFGAVGGFLYGLGTCIIRIPFAHFALHHNFLNLCFTQG